MLKLLGKIALAVAVDVGVRHAMDILERRRVRAALDRMMEQNREILLVSAGDPSWEPTDEEKAKIYRLFEKADLDPTGSVTLTKQ